MFFPNDLLVYCRKSTNQIYNHILRLQSVVISHSVVNTSVIYNGCRGLDHIPVERTTPSTAADRMRRIIATLNVGRVLKFYIRSNSITTTQCPSGVWLSRQNGKEICLHYDYFVVKAAQNEERLLQLRKLYPYDMVPHMEKLFKKPSRKVHPNGFNMGRHGLRVGQCRKPRAEEDAAEHPWIPLL